MSSRTTQRDSVYIAASAMIVIAAFMLRIYQIGQDELWLDEGASFYIVALAKWPQALLRDNTPPLYYSLLHAWMSLFGQTESAMRMLSALCGTLFVAASIWFGSELIDRRAGLWSGAISALSPVQIYYSQEARSYALLLLVLTLAYGSLCRALATGRPRWWAAFSVSALLALYSHYFACLGLIPTALLVWLWPDSVSAKQKWLRYAVAASCSILLFLPWLFWSFQSVSDAISSIDWIRGAWRRAGPSLAIPKSLEVFTLGSQAGFTSVINVKRFGDLQFPVWLRLVGLAAAAVLGILAALPWKEKELGIPWLARRKAWLWTLLFFPLVVLWTISFYKPVYAMGRYEIVAFPAFALLLGLAFAKLQSIPKEGPILACALAGIFFVPIGAKLVYYYNVPPEDLARRTTAFIHEIIRNQDVLVLSRPRAKTSIYYLTRLGYQWQEGRCHDGAGGHAFACWIFPSDMYPRHTEALREQIHRYIAGLGPPDGVLWVVFDGEVLSSGRLKGAQYPESLLVSELERANLQPVPYEPDYGLVYFR